MAERITMYQDMEGGKDDDLYDLKIQIGQYEIRIFSELIFKFEMPIHHPNAQH